MSSTYTVTVDIDVANQTVTASDNSITVPTSNYEIVTFDGKSCIRSNASDYATFVFGKNIESFTCKIFLQTVNYFTLFVEVDSANNTKYSLVYNTYYSKWLNPDDATFDPNKDLVGTWVTVTYSNSNKTLTFDNGSTQLTRSLDNYLVDLSIGSFANRYNVYLTDLEFDVAIPGSKYLNGTGLSEVWANTKNYISSQLLGKSDVGHTHSYNDLTDKPTIPDVSNYYTKAEVDTLISNTVDVCTQEVYTMEVLSDDVSASIRVIEDDTDTNVANYSTVEQAGDVDVL